MIQLTLKQIAQQTIFNRNSIWTYGFRDKIFFGLGKKMENLETGASSLDLRKVHLKWSQPLGINAGSKPLDIIEATTLVPWDYLQKYGLMRPELHYHHRSFTLF